MTPIYKAKNIDNKEYTTGYLQKDGCGFFKLTNYIPPVGYSFKKIDVSTLEISFDEGTNWYSIENVEFILSQNTINNLTCKEISDLPDA